MIRAIQRHCKKDKSMSCLYILSIMTMIFTVIFNIGLLCITFDFYPSWISCDWQIAISYISYINVKACLFYLFLERLVSVFNQSVLQFQTITINISRVIIFIIVAGIHTLAIIYACGEYNGMIGQCVTIDGKWTKGMNIRFRFKYSTINLHIHNP